MNITRIIFSCIALLVVTISSVSGNIYNQQVNGGSCGKPGPNYVGRRIVGGKKALPDEFPYQVILGAYDPQTIFDVVFKRPRTVSFFCGGTVLNDRWIITAAHCLQDEYGVASNLVVGAAVTARHEIANSVGHIAKVVVHRGYTGKTRQYSNDIALLKTVEPISSWAKRKVEPTCLPDKGDTSDYQIGIISGFGQIAHNGPVSHELLATSVPLASDAHCQRVYRESYHPKVMMCAGEIRGGKDTCQGDSGGPLVGRKDGSYVLLGVTSFGYGCGEKYTPGVYTKVEAFTDWIVSNID